MYIPLPDIKGRIAMVKRTIEKNKIQMTSDEVHEIAERTEGYLSMYFRYSGSDISSLVNDALMTPVRTLDKIKKWVQITDPHDGKIKYAPVNEFTQTNANS